MRYEGDYAESVRSSISSAITNLEICITDSTNITSIPDEFERKGDINNVISGISDIKLDDINSEIESFIEEQEGTEKKAVEEANSLLDDLNIGKKWTGMLNDLNNETASAQEAGGVALKKAQDDAKKRSEESKKKFVPDMINMVMALRTGAHKMGESISDAFKLRTTELQIQHNDDIYQFYGPSWDMYGEEVTKKNEKMRKKAMTDVEKDKAGEASDKLYKKYKILEWADQHASDSLKRTGALYNVIKASPPMIASATIMAVAPEAAPVAIPAFIGATSAGGAQEEYLHMKKANSKEGIIQMHEKGEISDEEFEMYNHIWNLNDKQYKRDVTDNDNLSESEKEYLEAIRNMDDEWTTEKNLKNAEKYGAAVGTYNAAQSALGMQLYKLNPFKLNLLNQGMRVMIDTGSGASNVPAKASFLAAIDEDIDFNTAYEELGGTKAVLVDAGMSFGFSVIGEIIQETNSGKTKVELDSDGNIPITRVEADSDGNVPRTRVELDSDGKIPITRVELDSDGNIPITRVEADSDGNVPKTRVEADSDGNVPKTNSDYEIINKLKKTGSGLVNKIDEAFYYDYIEGGNYGCNQGAFSTKIKFETPDGKLIDLDSQLYEVYNKKNIPLKIHHNQEYLEAKNMLETKYGMSSIDASKTMAAIDSEGACGYAEFVNEIIAHWGNDPQKFEKIFGVPLYKKNPYTGRYIFNSEELLADIYISANTGNFKSKSIFDRIILSV